MIQGISFYVKITGRISPSSPADPVHDDIKALPIRSALVVDASDTAKGHVLDHVRGLLCQCRRQT